MRHTNLTRIGGILLLAALVLVAPVAAREASAQADAPRPVKVLVVSMFEVGDPTGDTPGEAQSWIEGEALDEVIEVPGSYSPVYCNADDLCLVVTNVGTANAVATLMAVGMSGQFDLSRSYILVAGIAGIDPADGTLGSAAWADWVVDGDLAHEYDAREMPEDWDYPYFRLGCDDPWCEDGSAYGNEVFRLNPALVDWAFTLSQDVELLDSEQAAEYRANYPAGTPASEPPSVLRCDTLAASTYWHGALLSDWAQWWMEQWTGGAANYCTTEMEDSGTLTALTRMAERGLVDLDRVMVLRTASNFDQPYPGQTPAESMAASSGGFIPSVVNAYRVGSAVTDHIIAEWDLWEAGVPEFATVEARQESVLQVAMLLPGQIDDGGFMEAGYNGLLRIEEELGAEISYVDGVAPELDSLVAALHELAAGEPDLIIAHGGQNSEAVAQVAPEYPDIKFVVVQGNVTGDNLSSYEVLQEQSAFLAGAAAGLLTETDVVGHISGIEVTPGLKARAAFAAGLALTNPDARFLTTFTGSQDDASLAKQTAEAQIAQGADIIFTMLNAARSGVIEASREQGIWQIGNVRDWYEDVPDVFIASAIANSSMAGFLAAQDVANGTWEPGQIVQIGLEEPEAVRLATAPHVPQDVLDEIEALAAQIVAGDLEVPTEYTGEEFVPAEAAEMG